MDNSSSNLVRPLHLAENNFLEILITRFSLKRKRNGVHLDIAFGKDVPAIWNLRGKYSVKESIDNFAEKSKKYQASLDDFILNGKGKSFDFDDAKFPFRYVSGGTLPIVRIGDKEYFCFFYREIFPIGWNIANGGSDNSEELLNPFLTIERELREELVVLDVVNRKRFVFKEDSEKPLDAPNFNIARRVWNQLFPGLDISNFEELTIPIKWIRGFDSMSVQYNDGQPILISDCFLNINAEDFGIEIDNVAKIDLSDHAILCDGEISKGQLINMPIGLFEVGKFNEAFQGGATEFRPDSFFYNAHLYDGELLDKTLEQHILFNCRAILSDEKISYWQNAPNKYDLCPVTRRIAQKFIATSSDFKDVSSKPCEIFISFGGPDSELAEKVFHFFRAKSNAVFFSKENREVNYSRAINDALDSAQTLIAVGSDPQNLNRNWPAYEWGLFHNDIMCGLKPSGQIVSFISGFNPVQLPGPLRYYQSVNATNREDTDSLDELAKFVLAPHQMGTQPV